MLPSAGPGLLTRTSQPPLGECTARASLSARGAGSEVRALAAWPPSLPRADIAAPTRGHHARTRPSHRAESVKDPGVKDVGDVGVGRKTKPLERAEREFDMTLLLERCADWRQVKSLLAESPHLFQTDHDLTCAALLKASHLIGPMRALGKTKERAEAKALVDALTELLVPRMNRLQGQSICGLVLCLKRLGYAPNKLITPIFLYLSEKERLDPPNPAGNTATNNGAPPERRRRPLTIFTVAERFALLAVFAQMGLRPPAAAVNRALSNSFPFLKFCTPQDLSNLALAMHSWRAVLSMSFVMRLMSVGRAGLTSISGSALASLVCVLGSAGYECSTYHKSRFLEALAPALSSLPSPAMYPALMHALLRLDVNMPPEFFDAMCCALAAAPPAARSAKTAGAGAGVAPKRGAKAAQGAESRVAALGAAEVVVVLGVLGVQSKYTAEKEFLQQLLARLQERCSELSPREAGCALQVLPAVLKGDADAVEDAADLLDELLAVVEGGMEGLRADELQALASATAELGHSPDETWSRALGAELTRRLTAAPGPGTGRPSLVAMAGVLAALPAAARAQVPVGEIVRSLLKAGRKLGGFDYSQLEELRRSCGVLGVGAAARQLPESAGAELALDAELEGEEGGDGMELFVAEPRDDAGDGDVVEVEAPMLVGWAVKAGPDLPRLLRDIAEARGRAAAAARATAAGRQRSSAPAADSWGGGQQQQGMGGWRDDAGAMDDAWEDRGATVQRGGTGGGFGAAAPRRDQAAWGPGEDSFGGYGSGGWFDAGEPEGRGGRGGSKRQARGDDEDGWGSGSGGQGGSWGSGAAGGGGALPAGGYEQADDWSWADAGAGSAQRGWWDEEEPVGAGGSSSRAVAGQWAPSKAWDSGKRASDNAWGSGQQAPEDDWNPSHQPGALDDTWDSGKRATDDAWGSGQQAPGESRNSSHQAADDAWDSGSELDIGAMFEKGLGVAYAGGEAGGRGGRAQPQRTRRTTDWEEEEGGAGEGGPSGGDEPEAGSGGKEAAGRGAEDAPIIRSTRTGRGRSSRQR